MVRAESGLDMAPRLRGGDDLLLDKNKIPDSSAPARE